MGWFERAHNFNPIAIRYVRPIFESVIDDIDRARPISFASAKAPPGMLIHGKKRQVMSEITLSVIQSADWCGSK